jgi:ribose 5-phosphate isomerase B
MRLGIATDHGGFWLKEDLLARLAAAGHAVVDFGADRLDSGDDYPDFVTPLAREVAAGNVEVWARLSAPTRFRAFELV